MIKNYLVPLLLMLALCIPAKGQKPQRKADNEFFAFNNAFYKKGYSFEKIATILADLGYDGIEHRETKGILELKEELNKKGLRVIADYAGINIENEQPYNPAWKEVIPKFEGTGLIIWFHIHSKKYESSDPAGDKHVVPILRELADFARPYGVNIAIYHHINNLAETFDDSYRLAKKTDRPNVGAVFNLCHYLRTDTEANLPAKIQKAAPLLMAASINGADEGDTPNMGWDRLIQPLGEGSFDVYNVLRLLYDAGFEGPVGVQTYSIKGKPEDFLKNAIEVWNQYNELYNMGINTLTPEEKDEGWELVFNGYSPEGWKSVAHDGFPEKGWDIKNGELRVTATGGGASAHGGYIITKEEYGDFELKWEWKMITKGGNSGLKYYVKTHSSENEKYGLGLEYQILDDENHPWMKSGKMQPNDKYTCGALYDFFPPEGNKQVNPLGEWNSSRIVSRNNQVEHWLNGEKILEYKRGGRKFMKQLKKNKFKDEEGFGQHEQGHILLQDHGSKVSYRNIKIKSL